MATDQPASEAVQRPASEAPEQPGGHTVDREVVEALEVTYAATGGPLGPLGQFGPLGPYGPLGPMGPVRWARPTIETAYEGWTELWEGQEGLLGPDGPLGPRGPLGPLGPLGPMGPLGALGLGPFADQPVDYVEEEEYRSHLRGSSYVVGSVTRGEADEVWADDEGFEDVYQIRLAAEDTITVVLTQSRPTPWFDVVLLDEAGAVAARSADAEAVAGGVKFLQATLPAGVYRVGISLDDGRTLTPSGERDYAVSVIVYPD